MAGPIDPHRTGPLTSAPVPTSLGHLLTLTVGAPAAGGTFVARHEGRVVFVRGAAPGETVVARLVDDPVAQKDARFWRAETLEVLEESVDRVPSVWPEAGIDGVGGAEWAHIALPAQRRLATEVLRDLLRRARVTSFPLDEVQVEPAPHDEDGLGWRTRERYAIGPDGRIGMHGWRSEQVHPVGENPLAARAIRDLDLPSLSLPDGVASVEAIAPSAGPAAVVLGGRRLDPTSLSLPSSLDGVDLSVSGPSGLVPVVGDGLVRERVGSRSFRVGATGFWQVHRDAAALLSDVVAQDLGVHEGDTVWDLYGGVGLFAGVLAGAVGPTGSVTSVEGDRRASALATENLADLPQVRVENGDVTTWVRGSGTRPDRVVLDPPRAGAGARLMRLLTRCVRSRIVYVSCDPSTLARDLVVAEGAGWQLTDLRAFDLFPHTHHIESVAVLEPAA
jgi:tRNA/tmRNA/rRNA uracil-C5-methylase (TrmA/RlmC/RlmD family)